MSFNGSPWLGSSENPVPLSTFTTSGATAAPPNYGAAKTIRAQLNVTAASGTTPTLDVFIEDSLDGGATWNIVGNFTQKTAAAREVVNIATPFSPLLRIRRTIGGTTPSFTFSVDWHVGP